MKISFLLIILGFSQVLGQNYESGMESKPKREDQLDNKIEVVNNNLADLEDAPSELAPSELAQPKTECRDWFTFCSSNEDCNQCSDCSNGAYCELEYITDSGRKTHPSCECFAQPQCGDSCSIDEDCEHCSNCSNGAYCNIPRDPGFNIGFKAGEKSFSCECLDDNYEYDNSMDYFNAKSNKVQSENEDRIIELGEIVSNNLEYSEAASSEIAQPKTECGDWETSCSSDEDCKQCSDCPNGAYCILHINDAGTKIYPSCECSHDYYEYDNSMDYFNAKSNKVQSENEDKVIKLEDMVNNNLADSEAVPSELERPKTECRDWIISCSSDNDCNKCSDCPNGGYCDLEYGPYGIGIWGACDCIGDFYECRGVPFHKKTPKITISVGISVPSRIGLEVAYKICFGNATCEFGLISIFGNPGAVDKDLPISRDHFNIWEDTVKTEFDRWTSIEILEGKDFIPDQTPPFVIIKFTDQADNDKDLKSLGKFVQLQKGVKKESYGDLLENYTEVKNFCDTIELDDRFLKLGDLDACNLGSVCKSNFPISISHDYDY